MSAAFFDIDGTLFDTRADLAATVNHTRRDLGLDTLPVRQVLGYVGQGARHLLEESIPECRARADGAPARFDYARVHEIFMGHYAEHGAETAAPYPGVVATLEELAARGWRLGVVTNKPNFAVHALLEKWNFTRFFGEAVVAGGDGVELKPSAAPLLQCARLLGLTRVGRDDWMVGDSWTDLRCAENAGVQGAFCAYGFGTLREAPYAVRLERLNDFLAMIRNRTDYGRTFENSCD